MRRKVHDRAAVHISNSDLNGHDYALYPGRELDWAAGRLGLPPRSFDFGFILVPRRLTQAEPDWEAVDHVLYVESSVEAAHKQLSYPGEYQLGYYVDLTGEPDEQFPWVDDFIRQVSK
jgi:hypothetical protein